jgi:hypothetical protein
VSELFLVEDLQGLKSKLLERVATIPGPLETDCWIWLGAWQSDCYGVIRWRGQLLLTHRVSVLVHQGPFPRALWCLHACHNSWCCAPGHLRVGTAFDNFLDRLARAA